MRLIRPAGALLVTGVVVAVGACDGASNSTPGATATATPIPRSAVDYPGRILLHSAGPKEALLQLTAASSSPSPEIHHANVPGGGTFVGVSADGGRFLYETSDQTMTVIGDGINDIVDSAAGRVSDASFSSDGTRVAAAAISGDEQTVIVYDVATKSTITVVQPPCAAYGAGAGASVCGAVGGVRWINATTLFVATFAGAMPKTVTCPPTQASCTSPSANTYSIVTTTGRVVSSARADGGQAAAPISARGNTVVLDDGTWLDLAHLSSPPRQLPAGVETNSLSPDGSTVVVAGNPWWQLEDLRTGTVQQLGTRALTYRCPTCDTRDDAFSWSPDGKFFAVQDSAALTTADAGVRWTGTVNVVVVPASSAKGGIAGILPNQRSTNPTGDISLAGWVR